MSPWSTVVVDISPQRCLHKSTACVRVYLLTLNWRHKRLCIRIGHYGAIQMLYYYYMLLLSPERWRQSLGSATKFWGAPVAETHTNVMRQ